MNKHPFVSAKIAVLLAGLVVIVDFTFIAQAKNYSFVWLTPAVAYVGLIWAALFGKAEGWQQKTFGWLLAWAFTSGRRAMLSVTICWAVAVAGGAWLYQIQHKPNLSVQVYAKSPQRPITNAELTVRNLASKQDQVRVTDADGFAQFRIKQGQPYQCRLRIIEDVRSRSTTRKLSANELALSFDIEDSGLDWVEGMAGTPGVEFAQVRREPATAFTDVSRNPPDSIVAGTPAFIRKHLPWGTPYASIIVARRAFVVGFDPSRKIPRWVAFHVRPGVLPPWDLARFARDPLLPPDIQANDKTYHGRGFDRGHLISPTEVAGYRDEIGEYSNSYSVTVPLDPDLNRHAWLKLKQYCGEQAGKANVWVIGGPAFLPAPGVDHVEYLTIGDGVAVPTHLFRVIIRQTADGPLEMLGVLIPNKSLPADVPWSTYIVAVRDIEQATGLRFMTEMASDVRDRLEISVGRIWD